MRAILDANLLISYLLDPRQPERTINQIVEAAVLGVYTMEMPARVLAEVRRVIASKDYIRDRVDESDVADFFELIAEIAERAVELPRVVPGITRDRNDDYLLAAAYLNDIDVLVSGDKDVLAPMGSVAEFMILSPMAFLDHLGMQP